MLVLSAYFDESEQLVGDDPFCLGGYLFKVGGYNDFVSYWRRHVLKHRGRVYSPFHTTDLISGQKVYEGLSIPDRLEILDRAIYAVGNFTCGAIGVQFDQKEFERKAPPTWPQRFGSIYTVACHFAVEATVLWLENQRCHLKVLYVLERGHRYWKEADEVLCAIRDHKDENIRKRLRYRAHLFEDKSEVGLQAADLYAWTVAKTAALKPNEIPRALEPFRESLVKLALAHKPEDRYKVHSVTGEWLDKHIEHSLTGEPFMSINHGPRRPGFR